jgi:penicillin amidase
VRLLAPLFDLVTPLGGDSETIDVAQFRSSRLEDPFSVDHGPSLRAIYDLATPEHSVFIQSTGEGGSPLSPLYSNMEKRWAEVSYVPMQLVRASAENKTIGVLHLTP